MNDAYIGWTDRAMARTHGKQVNFFSLSSLISPSSTHEPALTKNSSISRILVCDLTLQFASQRMLISPEVTLEKNSKKNQTKEHNNKNYFFLHPHPRIMMMCQFTSSVNDLTTKSKRQMRLSCIYKSLKKAWRRFCWKQPNPGCRGKKALECSTALLLLLSRT